MSHDSWVSKKCCSEYLIISGIFWQAQSHGKFSDINCLFLRFSKKWQDYLISIVICEGLEKLALDVKAN